MAEIADRREQLDARAAVDVLPAQRPEGGLAELEPPAGADDDQERRGDRVEDARQARTERDDVALPPPQLLRDPPRRLILLGRALLPRHLAEEGQLGLAAGAGLEMCARRRIELFAEALDGDALRGRGECVLPVAHSFSPRAVSRSTARASFRFALTMYAFAPLLFSSRSIRVSASSGTSSP